MKRLVLSVLAGAAMFVSVSGTSTAGWLHPADQSISIDGKPYYGTWAYIGDRPYVNIESFGKALGVPRRHNVRNWYLGSEGKATGSPFQMAVESGTVKVPTVNHGGATYVDLQAACRAMDIPFHINTSNKEYEVGDAYAGEFMRGAYQRWNYRRGNVYRESSKRSMWHKEDDHRFDPDSNRTRLQHHDRNHDRY